MTDTPIRATILETALNLTCGDRNKTYGDPLINLTDCADLMNAYLGSKLRNPITPADVASIMALVKLARTKSNVLHRDNYVDAAAYMAIAGEIAERTSK